VRKSAAIVAISRENNRRALQYSSGIVAAPVNAEVRRPTMWAASPSGGTAVPSERATVTRSQRAADCT
jgi:hypothetical protein